MDINARLEALKNGPKPFRTSLHFDNGHVEHIDQPWQRQQDALEKRYLAMIGQTFRTEFGHYGTLVNVTTETIQ